MTQRIHLLRTSFRDREMIIWTQSAMVTKF